MKQENAGNREFFLPSYVVTISSIRFARLLMVHDRGKGLGGSSAINGMLWNKPAKFDINGELAIVLLSRCLIYTR